MKKILFLFFIFILNSTRIHAFDNQVVWDINNLNSIEGFTVISYGNPNIITTDKGDALEFNENAITAPGTNAGERIQIKGNPFGASNTEFTIEMIFKPYETTTDFAPRIFHICRPDSMSGPRVMTMETRSTNTWTTDFYNKSVTGSGIMGVTPYPTGKWMHMAMTCKDNVLTGYVNGVFDVTKTGNKYTGLPATAEVSLGGRMNNVNYFKGAIRKLIFTPIALEPSQFSLDGITEVINIKNENYMLEQNYPNPVINSTVICYKIAYNQQVTIELYSLTGQKVKTLVNTLMNEGKHEINFEKEKLPAGIYFYTISTASGFKATKRMNIL